jgi:hypothetical protein
MTSREVEGAEDEVWLSERTFGNELGCFETGTVHLVASGDQLESLTSADTAAV